jgi:hypothetical protein
MPTPETIRTTLKNRISYLGVSQSELCGITDTSTAQLSRFINGARGTHLQDLQRIDSILSGMERLAATLAPVPIDFRNAPVVRELVSKMNKGALDIRIIDTSASPAFMHHAVGGLSALAGSGASTLIDGHDINDLAEKVSEILNRSKKSETYRDIQEKQQ